MATPTGYAEYFESAEHWGRSYDTAGPGGRRRVDTIAACLPADVGTILDVGCGDGFVTNELLRRGFDITGCDLSAEALRHVHGAKEQATSSRLPFDDRSFDCVLSALVLEHLPNDALEQSVRELARVASRYVLVDVPHAEDLRLAQTRCPQCATVFHVARHVRSIRRADVERWFPAFAVVAETTTGELILPRPAALQALLRATGLATRPSHARCPACGLHRHVEPQPATVTTAKSGLKSLAARVGLARREELVVLLRRRD